MRYFTWGILTIFIAVAISAAETVRYFDYETEDEISGEETENRLHIVVTYDEPGEATSVNYFDNNGVLSNCVGFFGKEVLYSETGEENGYKVSRIVPANTKTDNKLSFWVNDYNNSGNLTKEYKTNLKGDLIYDRSGICVRSISYNENGDEISTSYYGTDNEPVLGFGSFHRKEIDYHENGKIRRIAGYGISGEPAEIVPSYHSNVYEYDDNGNIVSWSFFAPDGGPADSHIEPGVHRTEYSYTNTGKRFETTSEKAFGLDSEPTTKNNWHVYFPPMFDHISAGGVGQYVKGIHRIEKELFEDGKDKSVSYFGIDNEPTNDHHNVNTYEFEWLDSYSLTSITAINFDGGLINGFFPGYVRLEYDFNDDKSIIIKALYGKNGEPIECKSGVHKEISKTNDDGRFNRYSYNAENESVDGEITFNHIW